MILADSHCHLDALDLKNYYGETKLAIAQARSKGVKYILCPGVTLEGLPNILQIVGEDPDLLAALGVHPTEKNCSQPKLIELLTLGSNKKIVAIGETGLDFYHTNDESEKQMQIALFKLHIQAARELNKPLIIHARGADLEIIRILNEEKAGAIGGVLHCFTGSLALAKAAIALGFYLSFSGIITFKKADQLREIAKNIPLEKILIETDAPYLAPEPIRGKANEPAYLIYIAEFMAKLLAIPNLTFAAQTTENFLKFYRY